MEDKLIIFALWCGAISCFTLYYIINCLKSIKKETSVIVKESQ